MTGDTINVAMNPMGAKTLLNEENFVPAHLELRNGLRTDGGNYRLRPGYERMWSLGVEQSIPLLIPYKRNEDSRGYAVTQDGHVYELRKSGGTLLYDGPTLNGQVRPTWCQFDQIPIICDGQAPVKIDPSGTTMSYLGGDPPAARFCSVIADRVVLSGYDATGWTWSGPGNAELWPEQNFSNVTGHGESIRYQHVKDQDLYFFKDAAVEVWSHIGGNEVFGRKAIASFSDKFSRNRRLAGESVVQGPQLFYFYADHTFWRLNGITAEPISGAYHRELTKLQTTDDMYGFHFAIERVIRWFAPTEGRCFVYDYVNDIFTEDNRYEHGQFTRLPVYSYMEVDGTGYVGDYDPSGTVYRWSDDLQSDNGHEIRLLRTLRVALDPKQSHQCRVTRLRLRIKRGHVAGGRGDLWPNGPGTFETGTETFATYAGGAVTTVVSGYSGSGLHVTAAAVLGPGGNYGGGVATWPTLTVGRRYRIRLMSKSLVGAPSVRVSVQSGGGDEGALSFSFSPTSVWQQFTHTATLDANKTQLFLWSSVANAQWVIDNIQIEDALEDRSPAMLVRWAFDEGEYCAYNVVDMGQAGDRDPYVDIFKLGVGRELKLEIVQTDSAVHLMTHANVTLKMLGR
jgi:hypothetical protein